MRPRISIAGGFGVAGPRGLPEIGAGDRTKDDDRRQQRGAGAKGGAPPFSENRRHRVDESHLREGWLQGSDRCQRIGAIGEVHAHDTCLLGEDSERLARPEMVDEPPAYADGWRKGGDDLAFHIADEDVLATRHSAIREDLRQQLLRLLRRIFAGDRRCSGMRKSGNRFSARIPL